LRIVFGLKPKIAANLLWERPRRLRKAAMSTFCTSTFKYGQHEDQDLGGRDK